MKAAPPKVTVGLVEDHQLVAEGMRVLIESRMDLSVVGIARSGSDACKLVAKEKPDVLLLDLDLGNESGIDSIAALRAASPATRIVIVSGLRDSSAYRAAIRAGAVGIVPKDLAPESLLRAIDRVHAGETWLDPATVSGLVGEPRAERSAASDEAARIANLSAREREVIGLVAEGLRNREIGRRLYISETTVRHHLTSIYGKLGVADRLALTVYAIRHRLVAAPR